MADTKDQIWIVVFGLFTINAVWTAYLEFRNIRAMEKSSTPPAVLNLSADEFNHIKTTIRQESYQKLINAISQFWIGSLQFHSNYYSYVWQLSGKYCSNMTARAMCYAALDQAFSTVLYAVVERRHSPSAVLTILSIVAAASVFALYTLLRIKIFENLGSSGMFLVLNIAGVAIGALVLLVVWQTEHQYTYTKLIDDDLGTAVKALAVDVGYPPDRIFILETRCCPNASYTNLIFSKWITIRRSLTYIMDIPEVVGVVAHELGHWKYCHPCYGNLKLLIVQVVLYFLYTVPYGNLRLLRIFSLVDAHPVLGDLLGLKFIGLPIMKLLIGCFQLLSSHHETEADDYACRIWDPKKVRDGEVKLHTGPKHHLHYDGLYSAWYTGYPSVVQRIHRIESHFHSNEHN